MLDSAFIVTPVATFPWGLVKPATGALASIDPASLFDWKLYAQRDKELAYRDHLVANGLVKVALEIGTIWGGVGPRPRLQVVVLGDLATVDVPVSVSSVGAVAHVTSLSVPFDAARVDQELYARDVVVYEAMARAAELLATPPLERIDPDETITGPLTAVWALGQGAASSVSISPTLPLDVALFKVPDMNLAFRDNVLAYYMTHLQRVLRNPFELATRLVVAVEVEGLRETEIYALAYESSTTKIFQAEPSLPGRLKILYDKGLKTLQWFTEDTLVVHIPQPQPYVTAVVAADATVAGPVETQKLRFVPAMPIRQDCQFWRQKAAMLGFANRVDASLVNYTNLASMLQADTSSGVSMASYNAVVQPQPTVTRLELSGVTLDAHALCRVALLFQPLPELVIPGGPGPGLDYPVVASSESVGGPWTFTLPPGPWQLRVHYTNVLGSLGDEAPDEFLVTVSVSGQPVQNLALRFGLDGLKNGSSPEDGGDVGVAGFQVHATGAQQAISITWNPPAGNVAQLRVIQLRLVALGVTPIALDLQAELRNSTTSLGLAKASLVGRRYRHDVINFIFELGATGVAGPFLDIRWTNAVNDCTLAFLGLEVLLITQVTPTPNVAGFQPLKDEFLRRAHESVLDGYGKVLLAAQAAPLDLRDQHAGWSPTAMARWVGKIVAYETRFEQAFRRSRPGDIGRPALVPAGLSPDLLGEHVAKGVASASLPMDLAWPKLCSLQPWMVAAGAYVAMEEFWINDVVPDDTFGTSEVVTPMSYGPPVAWFDVPFLGYADGQLIGDPDNKLTDRTGNGYDLTQVVGIRKPTLKAGIINGKDVIRFVVADPLADSGDPAFNQYLVMDEGVQLFFPGPTVDAPTQGDFTVIVVASVEVDSELFGHSTVNVQFRRQPINMTTARPETVDFYCDSAGASSITSPVDHDVPHMMVWRRRGADLTVRVNKVDVTDHAGITTNGLNVPVNRMGRSFLYFSPLGGDVGEAIFYNVFLTDSQLAHLYDHYMKPKWGLP
jgi:hypothetical protein